MLIFVLISFCEIEGLTENVARSRKLHAVLVQNIIDNKEGKPRPVPRWRDMRGKSPIGIRFYFIFV